MSSLSLARYSPASQFQFPKITDEEYTQYIHLFEATKNNYKDKITSVTNMGLRNMAQGEAGREEDYYECEAWVQLELKNLHEAWEAAALMLFDKAGEGKIFED